MLTRLASCGRAWQLLPPLPPSRPCSPPPPPPHPSTPPPPRWSVSTTKIHPTKPQSPTTLIPLPKHNSTLGVPQSSKSRQNPICTSLSTSFPQSRDRSINFAARIPGTTACSRTQWLYLLWGALLVSSSALDLSLATGDENQDGPDWPTCQLLLSTTDESASTFGLKLPPFSLSRSSFEVEMSWNLLLPASPHILILARKQSAAIKLWPKLRRSSLLGNQFSILSIYLAPLPNLWLLPSFFSDTSQLSPQIAKPFSRADHSAKGPFYRLL